MSHLLLSHPIPKPFAKNGKKDVLKVVPHIEVLNNLGIRFCQAWWLGIVNNITSEIP